MNGNSPDADEEFRPARLNAPRILMVEDEEPLRSVLSDYFAERGYDIEVSDSGRDALRAADDRPPDVMILDLDLGGDPTEGLDVFRRTDHSIPIILLAGHEDDTAKNVRPAGAFDCLMKPFAFARLRAVVDDALGSPHERRGISA